MFGPIKYVVFDFDGTLVDTMPSVARGLGEAVEHVTGTRPGEQELFMSFGASPQGVLEKWMPVDRVPAALKYWLDFEERLGPADMVAFPEVEEMLKALAISEYELGIFIGRDRHGTLKILAARGWLGKYVSENELACGDDGHAAKPLPDGLIKLLDKNQWKPSDTLMVGDHPYDMMAGRAAGTKTGAALWDLPPGRTARARFRDGWKKWDTVECDLRIANPLSLVSWLTTKSQ